MGEKALTWFIFHFQFFFSYIFFNSQKPAILQGAVDFPPPPSAASPVLEPIKEAI